MFSDVLQTISMVLKSLEIKRCDPEFLAHSVYKHMSSVSYSVEDDWNRKSLLIFLVSRVYE